MTRISGQGGFLLGGMSIFVLLFVAFSQFKEGSFFDDGAEGKRIRPIGHKPDLEDTPNRGNDPMLADAMEEAARAKEEEEKEKVRVWEKNRVQKSLGTARSKMPSTESHQDKEITSLTKAVQRLTTTSFKRKDSVDLVPRTKVNGAILFLSGPMWEGYFFEHALPRLEKNFLRCFPFYPVHVFHEQLKPSLQQKIADLLPSAPRVDFEDVSPIWKGPLPAGISEAQLKKWMNSGVQAKFQGRGYRIMCRFWSGLVWMLPSMQKYDFYWRLDTDSILPTQALVDPFQIMNSRGCLYGFNRLKGENPHVLTELWPTYLEWLRITESVPEDQKSRVLKAVKEIALDKKTGKYLGPMYYNNFELGSLKMKRNPTLQAMFHWMDSKPDNGFLKYRWGDAPWHTLAVHTILAMDEYDTLAEQAEVPDYVVSSSAAFSYRLMCNFTKTQVPYRHAARKPGPVSTTEEKCAADPSFYA